MRALVMDSACWKMECTAARVPMDGLVLTVPLLLNFLAAITRTMTKVNNEVTFIELTIIIKAIRF